ncbi:MAG: hypothetical protein ABI867_02585 [Kofleriaceae bacterium]
MRIALLVAFVACSTPPPPPMLVRTRLEVGGNIPGDPVVVTEPGDARQPAYIKLRLGHFRSDARGVGLTIDRTDRLDRTARVRFDHERAIIELTAQPGSRGRTDYVRADGRLVLHVWIDGRVEVYVHDPYAPTSSDGIPVIRDADADPL